MDMRQKRAKKRLTPASRASRSGEASLLQRAETRDQSLQCGLCLCKRHSVKGRRPLSQHAVPHRAGKVCVLREAQQVRAHRAQNRLRHAKEVKVALRVVDLADHALDLFQKSAASLREVLPLPLQQDLAGLLLPRLPGRCLPLTLDLRLGLGPLFLGRELGRRRRAGRWGISMLLIRGGRGARRRRAGRCGGSGWGSGRWGSAGGGSSTGGKERSLSFDRARAGGSRQ